MGAQSCMDDVKASTSSHAAFGLLGLANAGKMTAAERNQAVRDFFKNHREELLDQLGRSEFESRVKEPRRIPDHEIRGKIREYRAHRLRANANPNNAKVNRDFIEFKTKNRELLSTVSRLYDARRPDGSPSFYETIESNRGVTNLKFDAYRPMMVGNNDIANMSWEDMRNLPDKVTGTDGRTYDTRSLAKNQAARVLEELESEMLKGRDLNTILRNEKFRGWGYSSAQTRSLAISVKDVALRSQIEGGKTLTETHLRTARNVRAENRPAEAQGRSRLKLGRLGLAGGGALFAMGAGVAQIVMENQASCDRAFPHTVTKYRQPHTTGLGDASRCHMEMPGADSEVPAKVRAWLYGNELDAIEVLNSSSGGNSPCTYATRLYNVNFCNPDGAAEGAAEEGVQ